MRKSQLSACVYTLMKQAVHAWHASTLILSWSCTHQVELWTTEVKKNFFFHFTEAWNFAKDSSYCRESECMTLLFSCIAALHLLTQILRINPCTWLLKWMYYFYLHWWEKWWFQANCDYNISSIFVGSPYHARLQVWVVQVLSKERHTE